MNVKDEIRSIEDSIENIVAHAHEGTIIMAEIEDFERRVWGRIVLVKSYSATLERLEFIRSLEATIKALP